MVNSMASNDLYAAPAKPSDLDLKTPCADNNETRSALLPGGEQLYRFVLMKNTLSKFEGQKLKLPKDSQGLDSCSTEESESPSKEKRAKIIVLRRKKSNKQ